jgi:hypothetical protein
MQFDKTRIAIRERDLPDILDLALAVVRIHWRELLIASIVGMVPLAALNFWLLAKLPLIEESDYAWYAFRLTLLVLFEAPLAAAPATLVLGQAMFVERIDAVRIIRQLADLWPQLLVYQLLLRALWMPQAFFWEAFHRNLTPFLVLWFLFWIVPYVMRPYLNEVILLERNPLSSQGGAFSTRKRAKILHDRYHGDLFTRMLGCAVIGVGLTGVFWLASWYVRGFFSHDYSLDQTLFTIHLSVALWLTAAFFNVVRFLSYLDLRIRREGWEVELVIRAEAERLARQQAIA